MLLQFINVRYGFIPFWKMVTMIVVFQEISHSCWLELAVLVSSPSMYDRHDTEILLHSYVPAFCTLLARKGLLTEEQRLQPKGQNPDFTCSYKA
jgi:hypothetical protein